MTMTATRQDPTTPTPPRGRGPIGRVPLLVIVVIAAVLVAGLITALAIATTSKPAANVPIAQPTPQPTAKVSTGDTLGSSSTAPVTSTFTAPAVVAKGITATVTSLEAIQGTATLPGEVAGPAIKITIALTNDTTASLPLNTVVVNAYYGTTRIPANELSTGESLFSGSVPVGQTVSGTYIFAVPLDQRSLVSVEFSYSVDTPIVAFTGSVPR